MLLYIILLHWFEVFLGGSFIRSNTIELAVQPVLNGWTNEPVNRQPHWFDGRSGPNNYAWFPMDCSSNSFVHEPVDRVCSTVNRPLLLFHFSPCPC